MRLDSQDWTRQQRICVHELSRRSLLDVGLNNQRNLIVNSAPPGKTGLGAREACTRRFALALGRLANKCALIDH